MKSVKVIPGKNGQVIQQNPNKPDMYFLQVEDSEGVTINGNFLQAARKGVLTFNASLKEAAEKAYPAGKLITGQIVVKETRTPQYTGHVLCQNPSTKQNALRGGQPYYRTATFTPDLDAKDVLLSNEVVASGNTAESLLANRILAGA